jgi:DNA-binding MarR family transcriptional regulator
VRFRDGAFPSFHPRYVSAANSETRRDRSSVLAVIRVVSVGLGCFSNAILNRTKALDIVFIACTLHIGRGRWIEGGPFFSMKDTCAERDMNRADDFPRLFRAAYLSMHRASESHFTRYGITADQFVVLACLRENDAVMQQDLVRRAASDPSTIRAMLVLLEGRGLVSREPHPADGRAREVRLTDRGRRLCERLWRTSAPIRTQLLAGFSEQETLELLGFLRRVIQNTASMEKCRRRPSKHTPMAANDTI